MEVLEPLAAIGVVLALLGGTLWWLRRRGMVVGLAPRRVAGRRLECIERLPLAPQLTLHLVRLGDTALLVAASPAGCTLLTSTPVAGVRLPGEDR